MRRRRINLSKQPLNKWFVKLRRRYKNRYKLKRDYSHCVNYEFD